MSHSYLLVMAGGALGALLRLLTHIPHTGVLNHA